MKMSNSLRTLFFGLFLIIFGGWLTNNFSAYGNEISKYQQYQLIGSQALQWIGDNVDGYNYKLTKLPDIEFMTAEQLWDQVMPNTPYDPDFDYYAVYSQLGYIIISDKVDLNTLFGQSVIVHELVHYYQQYSGQQFECRGAKEKQAYQAQEKWLAEKGVNIWDHLDQMFVMTIIYPCHNAFGFY